MSECKICKKNHSQFHMNNKLVCFSCDELLFDIEIECDEEVTEGTGTTATMKLPTRELARGH